MPDNITKTDYAKRREEEMTKKEAESSSDSLLERFKSIIRDAEGLKLEAYKPDPTEEHWTIGFGRYGAEIKEGDTITEETAEEMLDEDVSVRIDSLKKLLPEFDTYPDSLKDALFSEHYRGSIEDSPKTVKAMLDYDFDEAALEYLRNTEYEEAEEKGIPGIRPRMEKLAEELGNLSAK
jgi:GH24 family phage-related lysozyme (muramidase)